jgi:hypothetical protein
MYAIVGRRAGSETGDDIGYTLFRSEDAGATWQRVFFWPIPF